MPIIEQDLDFETHLREYGAYLKGTANEDAPWHHKAQLVHCCSVIQAIGDLQSEIVIVGQKIGPGKVYHQLVYGAAYRSKIIWTAARTLLNLIPPNRTEVLPHDEVFEVARALNDIYIHIRGMLDNYAWALIHLGDSDNLKKLRPVEAGFCREHLALRIALRTRPFTHRVRHFLRRQWFGTVDYVKRPQQFWRAFDELFCGEAHWTLVVRVWLSPRALDRQSTLPRDADK